jgi:hypothetical protein
MKWEEVAWGKYKICAKVFTVIVLLPIVLVLLLIVLLLFKNGRKRFDICQGLHMWLIRKRQKYVKESWTENEFCKQTRLCGTCIQLLWAHQMLKIFSLPKNYTIRLLDVWFLWGGRHDHYTTPPLGLFDFLLLMCCEAKRFSKDILFSGR